MVINVVNPFKSQASKTFGNSRIRRDIQEGEPVPPMSVALRMGKKLFKSGTTAMLVDVKARSLEDTSVQSSSLLTDDIDIRAGTQNVISKVKSVKRNITRLFKSTSLGSSTVDPPVFSSFDDCSTTDHSSTTVPSPIAQHPGFNAPIATASDSIPPGPSSLGVTSSSLASGKNGASESIEDVASDLRHIVEASSLSQTQCLFVTPVSPPDALSSPSLSNVRCTTDDDGTTFAVVNTELTGLSSSISYISWSSSGSEITVYFSSNSLSVPSTANEVSLVGSETNPPATATSFATSIDAGEYHQLPPTVYHRLRRMPNYEDLRNPEAIPNCNFSRSNTSELSYYDISDGVNSSIHATPILHAYVRCDNLRKSFMPCERKIGTPSICPANKFDKLRAWLITRCHKASHNTRRASTAQLHRERWKVAFISPSRQFLRGVFCPSARMRENISKPAYQPSAPSSLLVWSCAKITRSSSKAKRRRRMPTQSMRALKARLDLIDIDPWY